eukprot:gene25823-biopygen9100
MNRRAINCHRLARIGSKAAVAALLSLLASVSQRGQREHWQTLSLNELHGTDAVFPLPYLPYRLGFT